MRPTEKRHDGDQSIREYNIAAFQFEFEFEETTVTSVLVQRVGRGYGIIQ